MANIANFESTLGAGVAKTWNFKSELGVNASSLVYSNDDASSTHTLTLAGDTFTVKPSEQRVFPTLSMSPDGDLQRFLINNMQRRAELAAPENRQDGNRIVIAGRDSLQDSVNHVGQELARRNLNIQPTLTERPGLPVRVIVNRDLVLRPYQPLFFQRGEIGRAHV